MPLSYYSKLYCADARDPGAIWFRAAAKCGKNANVLHASCPGGDHKTDEQYSLMKKKQHSRLPREQRMREIMQVAAQVFREKGYSEALTAQIAARAGVVEGTIYRYFPGKRELLIRVVEQWYERILADYDQQ